MSQWRGSEDDAPGSKNQPAHNPPLNGLIPRDYLGARSEVASRPGAPGSRHISPSPLHTTSLPNSRLQDSPSSQSPLSPRSSANPSPSQNRSPISRIANAPFPAPPSNSVQNLSPSPDIIGMESGNVPRPGDGSIPKPPGAADPDRSASSSVSSILSAPGDRPHHRIMPRTSSIDSAISSLSSASQKSTFDANALSPADINNLINAAGSAEAVIVHLLREKHQAASQNSQLWKLVDKQRTLILGLNKDLERAFNEKEKYKKKLKELQDTAPPLPTAATASSLPGSNEAAHPQQATPGPIGEQQCDRRQVPQPTIIPAQAASRMPLGSTDLSPTNNLSSPVGSDGQKLPHPSRKPPPAPLDLRLPMDNVRKVQGDPDSESDYGDSQEERSSLDRGRRKTREEDDRDREATIKKEIDPQGSVSTVKYGSSHSSQGTATSASPATGPRELATRSPPNVGASGSLGFMLNSRTNPSLPNGRPSFPNPKSPGLPLSPRPEDRPLGSPLPRMPRDLNSMASQSMTAGTNLPGLPLSPRAGNYPAQFAPIPTIDTAAKIDSPGSLRSLRSTIYQGLVSDEYPGLLLPPNALPVIQVQVSSSRLRPSRNSYMAPKPLEEEPVFTLSVISRAEMSELWRVEKVIASLPQLDHQIRHLVEFPGRLPDRSIFSGHSPAKVDARRAALNAYFDSLLDTPMDEKAALVICQFLTNDAIEPRDDETSLLQGNSSTQPDMPRGSDGRPRKEGYLTKRGKNFGGWKARYFVLHGPELKYFESPGGPHMGTIKLHHAQIGKQSQNPSNQSNLPPGPDEEADNQYRHAFLVLEPKRKDSSALVRHVLCAESDDERDRWVEALMEYVESPSSDNDSRGSASIKSQQQTQTRHQQPSSNGSKPQSLPNSGSRKPTRSIESPDQEVKAPVQGFSFDDTIAAEPPILGSSLEQAPRSPRIPAALSTDFRDLSQSPVEQSLQSPKTISGPTNGAVIQDVGAWGNKTTMSTKEKKRSIWGFRTRSSFDLSSQAPAVSESGASNTIIQAERKDPIRPVFGIPLAEAVQYCAPVGVDVELPAVVYRCIEYLHSKEAALEEGIFRLSGSNVVIKALKERFNTEGDVDFIGGDQYYDVHAVASLFKQYLRELPTTVLTRELHLDFLRVLELDDRQKKITAFNALVSRLPRPNLVLLRALSLFLIEIVNNSDVNKMTVRNVGIVFAPTLNIPAPVFSMFLTDFDSIFGDIGSGPGPTIELTVDNSLSPDDVRSPRHQMFSDIPTPSYNQTSFRGPGDASSGPSDNPRAAHDTGFAHMQPSYDQPAYRSDAYNQHSGASASYGSLNGMLSPGSDDTRSAKTKRRESSMLFMEHNPGDLAFNPDK
ncbi:uncharacterized protein N7484_003769 [Penicillium longicatenatum]|uniref:uncharacterized protein n=1 Tax=Penicillium longicatenatum TaxID=1561947 RepID=UPI00254855AC|nr:uncharacterized protein N7484_003769 [Penicillium longicatenatum]KAJ5650046.1 hypothetical protein N7484_003769 [Penicillium longicatenatum]